jgi:hypothetical protein
LPTTARGQSRPSDGTKASFSNGEPIFDRAPIDLIGNQPALSEPGKCHHQMLRDNQHENGFSPRLSRYNQKAFVQKTAVFTAQDEAVQFAQPNNVQIP